MHASRGRAGLGIIVIVAAIGGVAGSAVAQSPAASPTDGSAAAAAYFAEGATAGSGAGIKIGYLALAESIPYSQIVTKGIEEQAAAAGAAIVVCDTKLDLDETLVCAQQLKDAGVDGVISFSLFSDDAADVCAGYGGVPTVALEFSQPPCERTFVGTDDRRAGEVIGIAMGEHLAAAGACDSATIVPLTPDNTGGVAEDRSAGALAGLASVCGEPDAARVIAVHPTEDTGDAALAAMVAALPTIPTDGLVAVFAPNDDEALVTRTAFADAGRAEQLRIASHGADEGARTAIACDPAWVAEAAFWPERFGRIAVPALLDVLAGKAVPADLRIPHVALTAATIRESYPDIAAC